MPKNLTPDLVKLFWDEATKKYNASACDKSDSEFMQLVAKFLDGVGILDKESFLNDFTTTIGDKIYIPFKIGEPKGGYDLWGQLTVGVHELVHVEQYHTDYLGFMVRYITSNSDRATYEAEAYSSDLQMHWWNYKIGYDIKSRAKSLLSYNLKQGHCDYAASYLDIRNDVLQQGGKVNDVATWAEQWLEEHGVQPDK